LHLDYPVERFVLIATTEKNAKTLKSAFSDQPIFPQIVYVL